MKEIDFFEFSDGWVFMSLKGHSSKRERIELVNIIAIGDMLNHSIFTLEKLQNGFKKLQLKGLIKVEGEDIILSEIAQDILKNVMNSGVGFFSLIDEVLKIINSKKISLENVDMNSISKCDFLTEDRLTESYNEYSKKNT